MLYVLNSHLSAEKQNKNVLINYTYKSTQNSNPVEKLHTLGSSFAMQ